MVAANIKRDSINDILTLVLLPIIIIIFKKNCQHISQWADSNYV